MPVAVTNRECEEDREGEQDMEEDAEPLGVLVHVAVVEWDVVRVGEAVCVSERVGDGEPLRLRV